MFEPVSLQTALREARNLKLYWIALGVPEDRAGRMAVGYAVARVRGEAEKILDKIGQPDR